MRLSVVTEGMFLFGLFMLVFNQLICQSTNSHGASQDDVHICFLFPPGDTT